MSIDPEMNENDDTSLEHHEYFYTTFKEQIFLLLKRNHLRTLSCLEEHLKTSPHQLFRFLEDLVNFDHPLLPKDSYIAFNLSVHHLWDKFEELIVDEKSFIQLYDLSRTMAAQKEITRYTTPQRQPDGLYKWIFHNVNAAKDFEGKWRTLESFIPCLTDETSTAHPELTNVLNSLRGMDMPTWKRLLEKSEIKRIHATRCMMMLFAALIVSKSRLVLSALIKFVVGVGDLIINETHLECLQRFYGALSDLQQILALETTYEAFKNQQAHPDESYDVLQYFLLPGVEYSSIAAAEKFYKRNIQQIYEMASPALPKDDAIKRKHNLVGKLAHYRLLELMYGRFDDSRIAGLVSFTNEKFGMTLLKQSKELCKLQPKYAGEYELLRKMHCAAFNYWLSVAVADETYVELTMLELPQLDLRLWERIINCERRIRPQVRGQMSRTVNIRRGKSDYKICVNQYLHRIRKSPLETLYTPAPDDLRLSIRLERDELNEHECAAQLTGFIINAFNGRTYTLPEGEVNDDNVPLGLTHLRKAFNVRKDNVVLFMLRIVSNTRMVFSVYLRYYFLHIVNSLAYYLQTNNTNYLVRDFLAIVIDKKFQLKKPEEVLAGQLLVELLIRRIGNVERYEYDYNFELIEELVVLWKKDIKIPVDFGALITADHETSMRLCYIFFREKIDIARLMAEPELYPLVRKYALSWQQRDSGRNFEVLGYYLHHLHDIDRNRIIRDDLMSLFATIKG